VYWLSSDSVDQKQYKKIGVSKVLITDKRRFVTITSGEHGTSIYLEGKPVKHFPETRLIAKEESIAGRTILIGNSPEATNSWAGDLFGLAIYDHSLMDEQVLQNFQWWTQNDRSDHPVQDDVIALYTFNERSGTWAHSSIGSSNPLLIPTRLQFEKRILVPPKISHLNIMDVIINVIGFIPFGIFICLWLIRVRLWDPRRAYIMAIVLGVFVSLTIELLQVYLPARDSSLTDLICNTLGTILGVGTSINI
jgi:hypothetical protein